MLLLCSVFSSWFQLKKAVRELNTAVEQKDEISQRCHELDLQVSSLGITTIPCHIGMLLVLLKDLK